MMISLISLSFNKISEPKFDLIGSWKTQDFFNYAKFVFDKDGYALIDYDDNPIGGKKFERGGKFFSLEYEVDFNTEPKQLDLTFTNLNSGNKMMWRGIIEIINENKIRFARGGNNEPRPKDFNEKKSITLERMK